jgi:hypothetical protein
VKAKLPDRSAECWTVVQDTGLGCQASRARVGEAGKIESNLLILAGICGSRTGMRPRLVRRLVLPGE